MERDVRGLDIGTIGALVEGRTERQFASAMRAVIDGVLDPESARADGIAKGTVMITITVDGTSVDDGGRVSMTVDVASKPPKLRSSGASLVSLGGGDYGIDLTEPQQKLFEPRVSRGERE